MIKYKFFLILIFFLICSSFYTCIGKDNTYPLLGKVIYIDPGHGGKDPGAVYKDIYEKNINLDISLKLTKKLENLGATVYMTRYGDYDLSVRHTSSIKRSDLSRRARMINKSKADMYISIHLNSDLNTSYNGLQIFYNDVNSINKKIANYLKQDLSNNIRNIKKIKKRSDLYLYKNIKIPGILIEVGYLSNSGDRYLLKSDVYQEKITTLIANSVNNFYNK